MSSSFPWGADGLDKSRFEAYAKLLRLKNGGQIEEASSFSEMPDEETEVDKPDDADSVNANAFSLYDERKLKRAFLDRLSELIANEKGGPHVSSSLMIEWPDRVDILVARNNGFREGDATLRMLETIASSLRDISAFGSSGLPCLAHFARGELTVARLDPAAASSKRNLWTSLVQSYRPRLNDYMMQAKRTLKETTLRAGGQVETLALDDQTPTLLARLEEFRTLVNVVASSPTQDGLDEVIKSAHDVFSSYKEHDFDEIVGSKAETRSLRDALGFLGKLQTCFNTLARSSERLSGFQHLRILPVMDPTTGAGKPKMADRNNAWSLGKTFSSLGLVLNDETVESLVGHGKKKGSWTKNKLLQRFDKLNSSVSEVHAEMRVILAATKHDCTGAVIFKYVGCSKRSCFLCSRVVQRYGSYTTRGCHGKLYNLWTVPEVPWLAEEERPKLVQALKNVERAMKESIRDGKTSGLVHARESTIGGSSVATRRQQSGRDPYMSSLVSEYLRSQRQEGMRRSSAGKGEDFASPDQPLPSGVEHEAHVVVDAFLPGQSQARSARTTQRPEALRGECVICEQETNRRCQFCNMDWFCSKRCQDRMSFYHLAKCSARSITTADILCKDVIGDEFPQDPETREHFGFNRCRDWREQSHLLGLYKGLIYLEVEAIQLNEWREKDILVSKIIETFSKVSEQSRGGYFPWFLRNQHILDNSIPPLQFDGQDNPLQRAIDAARPYLDLEDRNKDLQQLEPPSKRQCFLLYAMALDGSHPNPHWAEFDSWYDFGFAVCPGEHNERLLGGLYSRLVGGHKVMRDYYQSLGSKDEYPNVPTCSFNEFWLAYESGSLAKLFYHYGLGDMMDRDWGLREFLSFPLDQHELRPSVWRLKHFLALDPGAPLGRLSKIETAAQEYGFTSQLTARTRLALRQFYEQLFTKVNPLRVHEAKNRGKLLEYAESSLDVIDDGVRHVLRKLG